MEENKGGKAKKSGHMNLLMLLLQGIFGSVEMLVEGVIQSAKETTEKLTRKIVRSILILFFSLFGLIFLLVGVAQIVSDLLRKPGLGAIIVGGVILVLALGAYTFTRDNN